MMKIDKSRQVISRNEKFTKRIATRIWEETPNSQNSYTASSCRCYGYDLMELMKKCSSVDVIYLLLKGELPSSDQARIFECLMIALANPGPRHPAIRAAMNAGVGKTEVAHILPIAMTIMGGGIGAGWIDESIRFFRKHSKEDPEVLAREITSSKVRPQQGDWYPAPGFGSHFGGIDEMPKAVAKYLAGLPGSGKALKWGDAFADSLSSYGLGWLYPGLAAAVFSDLGFQPRVGAGLYQLLSGPGMLAHGIEMSNKPRTSLPFPSDEDYILE